MKAQPLFRFLLAHLAAGVLAAGLLLGLIVWFDVAGLASLAFSSPDGGLYLFLLFFGLVVTFGGVAMGAGIMALGRERD